MRKIKKKKSSSPKKKRKLRVKRIIFLGGILLLFVSSTPFLLHMKEMKAAQESYDIQAVEQEIQWISTKAPILEKLPPVRDGIFWLKLNRGNYEEIQTELSKDPNDKHGIWLIQKELSLNKVEEAEAKVQGIESESLRTLAEGLISAHKKEGVVAEETLLSIKDSKLTKVEQVLKYTTVVRLKMARNEFGEAGKVLNIAKSVNENYPLVKITEFDYLLTQGHWSQAKGYLDQLEAIPGYSENPVFLTKKALLALTVGERALFQETLVKLSELEEGDFYVEYLAGIDAYQLGNFKIAEQHFQNATNQNVPAAFQQEVQNAHTLAKERSAAEVPLVFLKNAY